MGYSRAYTGQGCVYQSVVAPGLQEAAAARFDQAFTASYNEHEKAVAGENNANI